MLRKVLKHNRMLAGATEFMHSYEILPQRRRLHGGVLPESTYGVIIML